ncbi:MAG: 2-C-methyl-D-erythritol 4-phosphate cytidylyltransferase [Acidobacteriota bacterium]|nr:2-C-methyl-D-erythritol 4-phosphate cytidylyltransferase [Acidobacteriota bacterium]
MKVFVIIPAAGLGTRMAVSHAGQAPVRSKQFLELQGVPILVHTLRKFAAVPQVDSIWIAMRNNEMEGFAPTLKAAGISKPVHLIEGGEHRQESVGNALDALPATPDDLVLIHDAVRPFIALETIQEVIEKAAKYGAVIAGVPAIDTIKRVERRAEGAVIEATIPREQIVQAQTPQGFRYGVLSPIFNEARGEGFLGTDEASLLERAGVTVHVVMGSPRNIKITTPADLALAEFILAQEAQAGVAKSGVAK